MTLKEAMIELEALGDEKIRRQNEKYGWKGEQFGAKLGDVRKVAAKIKIDHALAEELWKTGNLEARMLSILIVKPKDLSPEHIEAMVRDVDYAWLADWVNSYIVKQHPNNEEWREKWMDDSNPWVARAGWSLTSDRVMKKAPGIDVGEILDRLDKEMATAPEATKWMMNFALGYAGIHHPEHRDRVLKMGERIGAYKDYPVSKGCTSPYVPIFVTELASRQR